MSQKGGKRYPLVMYTHMMNRWAPAIFTLGLAMLALAWGLFSWGMEEWRWITALSVGGFLVVVSLFMWLFRRSAYVQPFKDYLKLVTPLFRLKISYKRIRRTSAVTMASLFPPNSIRKSQVDVIQPIAKMTAIVLDLNAFPMSPTMLRLFLSSFFFKDKTPHLVILVADWMRFSAELESFRTGEVSSSALQHQRDISILSKLPKK
ncbi:MAG: hypothetical protein UZ14_CFX002001961 [Chloroflexi bacterium OLB14]|nr:MAG: hypothetical protein UZ14_CFX002001961 [Chloroflexi bacterium OLB14]